MDPLAGNFSISRALCSAKAARSALIAYVAVALVCALASAVTAADRVPLFLYPQEHLADVSWPSHAVVAMPQGAVKPGEHLYLLENGAPIVSQIEVVSRWPDKSPKWVHAYASFRYIGGKPAQYLLVHDPKPPSAAPASSLRVSDTPQGIRIDTGVVKLSIPRPFVGIVHAEYQGQTLLEGPGGPSFVDDRGIAWHARHDDTAEIIIEQQGPAQITVKASGWYQTEERRVEPFCRFTTRITAFAGSSIVKFDHATIFAGDMREHGISELAFKFAIPEVQAFASAATDDTGAVQLLGGKLDDANGDNWFAQLSSHQFVRLTDGEAAKGVSPPPASNLRRSAGWFSAQNGERRVALLTKDFWQKYPKEVKVGRDELTYYAWPRHGELALPDAAATRPEGVYKFQCFLTGRLLDARLPNEYFSALESQTDTLECKPQYARAANLEGVAIHNEFALAFLPTGDGAAVGGDAYVAGLQKLYADSPIARVSQARFASSGVLGPVAPSGRQFPRVERAVRDGMLGYARSIERYGDYGWSIYGNTHHEELMNPEAAGVPGGRPSLHRVWSNNHYQHVSTSWRLFALHGDFKLLSWARTATDNYASIGQVRYDALRGRTDGKGQRHQGPGTKYHNPGAFWHCKAFVPWGGRDYGMDANDVDASLTGHWPDPSGLLFAWLVDADRWAKDGYDLWLKNVKLPTGNARREINTTLVHALTAYEYQPTPEILAAIKGMAEGLTSMPILEQQPGPIWEPTWLSRYHEMFPNDQRFNKYLVDSADAVGAGVESIWSLALSATAYRITKNDKYLRQHAGTLARIERQVFYDPAADKRWDQYGFGPGPARDGHFMLQWHRFAAALAEAKIESLAPPEEPGQYFCGVARWDNVDDIKARGSRILILRNGSSDKLTLDATTLSGGAITATSLELLSPQGRPLITVPRLPMSAAAPQVKRATRPSTWEVFREEYPVPDGPTGLYTARVGSGEIGLFQGLSVHPECQVLRSSKPTDWPEPSWQLTKFTRGYFVPMARGKIELTFTAMGQRDGSQVSLLAAGDKPVLARFLRAGESVSVTLNSGSDDPGPWLLDAFSDHSGFIKLSIDSEAAEPLLYGHKLQDVLLIREKLGKSPRAGA